MKTAIFLIGLLPLFLTQYSLSSEIDSLKKDIADGKLYCIDKIAVTVYGPERKHHISLSELQRVGIDGKVPTISSETVEESIYQDALRHKIPIDDYATRYIKAIKSQQNVSDEQVNQIFESAGLTVEEGHEKLQKMGANTTMIEMKVKSRILVTEAEIEEEFKKNPQYNDAEYTIEIAFLPFASQDKEHKEEQYAYLLDQTKNNTLGVVWGFPITLKENDIAENKKFITRMKINEMSDPQVVSNGFEVYRLVSKKDRELIPLEKRRREIIEKLRQPQFKEKFEQYVKELMDNAIVVKY